MQTRHRRLVQIAALCWLGAAGAVTEAAEHTLPASPGPYLQLGSRADRVVVVQITLGNPDKCESMMQAMRNTPELLEAMGSGAVWCSMESASNGLKYFGDFRNRVSGNVIRIEAVEPDFCLTAVEALTGGAAISNKFEVTTPCQAR